MYEIGKNLDIQLLYPSVQFPVSRKTPMISPLILWDHQKDWHVEKVTVKDTISTGQRKIDVDLNETEWEYVVGHVIEGEYLLPEQT